MSQPIDRQQLIDEINQIPDSHLQELFELLHYFRLGLAAHPEAHSAPASQPTAVLASLAGSWQGDLVREPQGTDEQRLEFE